MVGRGSGIIQPYSQGYGWFQRSRLQVQIIRRAGPSVMHAGQAVIIVDTSLSLGVSWANVSAAYWPIRIRGDNPFPSLEMSLGYSGASPHQI